jgi:hypothetical protein
LLDKPGGRHAVSPAKRKRKQAQKVETITHNSVFADHYEAGHKGALDNSGSPNPLTLRIGAGKRTSVDWGGYSSAGRAVALQAIGQGFESPYLQTSPSSLRLGDTASGRSDFAVRKKSKRSLSDKASWSLRRQVVVGPAMTLDTGVKLFSIGPVAQLVRACA